MRKETTRKMSLAAFRRAGFLQESNRLFFHPRGLALALQVDTKTGRPNGKVEVLDHRADGIRFDWSGWEAKARENAARAHAESRRGGVQRLPKR